jgi:ribosomal protein L7Ae-like RNA K-turn-binding protein
VASTNNLSYIGLAHRAGQTLVGTAACEAGLKRGKLRLLLLQEGLSPSTVKKFVYLCGKNNVDVLTFSEYDKLGLAIGRPDIMVLGITDIGFADTIKNSFIGGQGSSVHE